MWGWGVGGGGGQLAVSFFWKMSDGIPQFSFRRQLPVAGLRLPEASGSVSQCGGPRFHSRFHNDPDD